eukprot:evm.model.NODE_25855_length_27968_cov_19.710848.1
MEKPGEVHQHQHNITPIPIAVTTTAASSTTGRALRSTGMSGGSLGSFNSLNGSPNGPPGSNRRPALDSFAAAVRAQRRKEQLEQRREERDAADELFQLSWTVIAVLYLIAVLNTSSPYIPQHDGRAAALISQTKQWLTGTPDGTAWSAASATNYDKAHLVENLNSTILEAGEGQLSWKQHNQQQQQQQHHHHHHHQEEQPPPPQQQQHRQQLPRRQQQRHQQQFQQSQQQLQECNHPRLLQLLLLLLLLLLRLLPCPRPSFLPNSRSLWRGKLSNYHIVSECAASNSFEVMNRGDNPSRAYLNAIADWTAKNFMWNTQAMIVLTQLYW